MQGRSGDSLWLGWGMIYFFSAFGSCKALYWAIEKTLAIIAATSAFSSLKSATDATGGDDHLIVGSVVHYKKKSDKEAELATIRVVHKDCYPDLYYTIVINGKEKQTDGKNLVAIPKNSEKEPIKVQGDKSREMSVKSTLIMSIIITVPLVTWLFVNYSPLRMVLFKEHEIVDKDHVWMKFLQVTAILYAIEVVLLVLYKMDITTITTTKHSNNNNSSTSNHKGHNTLHRTNYGVIIAEFTRSISKKWTAATSTAADTNTADSTANTTNNNSITTPSSSGEPSAYKASSKRSASANRKTASATTNGAGIYVGSKPSPARRRSLADNSSSKVSNKNKSSPTDTSSSGVYVKTASNDVELHQILALQQANLKKNITAAEAEKEGFVTAVYTFDFLKQMNQSTPHVIAKDSSSGDVVGYVLAASVEDCRGHDLLSDLVKQVDKLSYKGKKLKSKKYLIIGQLCVKKGYRGQGLVQMMFKLYKDLYSPVYDYPVTDIARTNARSMKAFKKSGFDVIGSLMFSNVEFDVVAWDWRKM